MPFSSQFALSLEVTRLVPLGRAISKATEAVMSCARDLRHSGSDIVTEEDLTNVFGRNRIDPGLASSFKTIVCQSGARVPLWENIALQAGPGPTVFRGLKEPAYFSMVVQLSFLAWTCGTRYLSTALAECLQRRLASATTTTEPTLFQTCPDQSSILAVLEVCERQTSAFDWNDLLYAVAASLGYPTDEAGDLSSLILQGALDMFPMVQTLPEDRFVHIQVPKRRGYRACVCAFAVWAHQILGLSVTVQFHHSGEGAKHPNCHFGFPRLEQVLIEEVAEDCDETIILLDATKETLLAIQPEPGVEYMLIGSVRRFPLKGYGNVILKDVLENLRVCKPHKAVIEDLQLVVCAFAQILDEHLVRDTSDRGCDLECSPEDMHQLRGSIPYAVTQQRLLAAAKLLFDNPKIRNTDIERYKVLYSKQALDENLKLPLTLDAMARKTPGQLGSFVDD